jgi:hypothetical protein
LHFKNLKWSDGVCKNSFGKLNLKINFVSKHFERYDDYVSVEKEQLREKKKIFEKENKNFTNCSFQ